MNKVKVLIYEWGNKLLNVIEIIVDSIENALREIKKYVYYTFKIFDFYGNLIYTENNHVDDSYA